MGSSPANAYGNYIKDPIGTVRRGVGSMGSGGGGKNQGTQFREFGFEEDYFKLGSEDDYVNLSAGDTGQFRDTSQGLYQQGLDQLGRSGALDPNASFNLFMSQAPELQGLISGATSDFEQSLAGRIDRQTQNALQQTTNEFSNLGSLYSGGAMDIASQRAQEASADLTSQMNQLQAGLTGQLYGQGMQQAQQSVGGAGNIGLSMMGQGYSGLATLGTPQYVNPFTYASPQMIASQPGQSSGGLSGALGGASAGAAIGQGNPYAIAGGALLGYFA